MNKILLMTAVLGLMSTSVFAVQDGYKIECINNGNKCCEYTSNDDGGVCTGTDINGCANDAGCGGSSYCKDMSSTSCHKLHYSIVSGTTNPFGGIRKAKSINLKTR